MPTGYTAPVQEGKATFGQFVWGCARAFGALVTMRDDPMDAPIPEEFKPSEYYAKSIKETEARIAELEAMTDAELETHVAGLRAEIREKNARYAQEQVDNRRCYEAMLAQVEQWRPPTAAHAGLKKFMAEQLRESIQFDCGHKPYTQELPGAPGDWRVSELASLRDTLERSRDSLAKEVERVNERNAWVRALRESVPYETP